MGERRARPRRVRQLQHDPASLVWVRTQAKITQRAVAQHLGVSPGHMSEIESGKRNLTAKNLAKVAKFLSVPPSILRAKVAADAADAA